MTWINALKNLLQTFERRTIGWADKIKNYRKASLTKLSNCIHYVPLVFVDINNGYIDNTKRFLE